MTVLEGLSLVVPYIAVPVAQSFGPPIAYSSAFARNQDIQNRRSTGLRQLKRKDTANFVAFTGPGKRPRLDPPRTVQTQNPKLKMKFRRGRKRFRVKRRRRRTFKRRTFKRRGRRFLKPQPRKINERVVAQTLAPTDASGPIIFGRAPFSYNLSQGVGSQQFTGNRIFLRGVRMRVNFRMATPGTTVNDIRIRAWMVLSRYNTAFTAAGTKMNSTTTDVANPAASGNQSNLHQFDSTQSAWSPFVGDDITTPFDKSNVTILTVHRTVLKSQGTTGAEPNKLVDWWFPINRVWVIEDIAESALTAPFFGKYWTPYIFYQCFDGVGTTDATNRIAYDEVSTAYWSDIP